RLTSMRKKLATISTNAANCDNKTICVISFCVPHDAGTAKYRDFTVRHNAILLKLFTSLKIGKVAKWTHAPPLRNLPQLRFDEAVGEELVEVGGQAGEGLAA